MILKLDLILNLAQLLCLNLIFFLALLILEPADTSVCCRTHGRWWLIINEIRFRLVR